MKNLHSILVDETSGRFVAIFSFNTNKMIGPWQSDIVSVRGKINGAMIASPVLSIDTSEIQSYIKLLTTDKFEYMDHVPYELEQKMKELVDKQTLFLRLTQ